MVVKKGKMESKRTHVKYFAYLMIIGSALNMLACFHPMCIAKNGSLGEWKDQKNSSFDN